MAPDMPGLDKGGRPDRPGMADLVAPRRVFKRKRNNGLILALKIGFPLIALSCVGYIYYWWLHAPVVHPTEVFEDKKNPPQGGSDVTVKQVQYNGVDANNRPFSITAQSASQPQKAEPAPAPATNPDLDGDPAKASSPQPQPAPADSADNESVVNLRKLIADMTMADGAWVAVQADNGVFHRDAGTVDLSGNVELFHDSGLSFETDAATVDLKSNWARGNQPVEGQNADGQLAAQGFEVRDSGQTVIFTGRAYLKLFPKQSGAKDSDGGGS